MYHDYTFSFTVIVTETSFYEFVIVIHYNC